MVEYYLKASWQKKYDKVTEKQYTTAERNAGFYPKSGEGTATVFFVGKGISGRIENGDGCKRANLML
ncbi:MAG: hypothetical protein KAI71_04500 [Candidatus Pacebacteria bacterium]|nr:hypothetical protein [Candidatus Paceibacterota bacterium]